MGIAAGPDGAVWFGEWGTGAIGRITTDGILTEYPLPTQNSGVHSIVAGPDGALWFTAWSHYWDPDSVGRITTAGAITLYPLPNATWPWGITVGSDGAVWFTESNVVKIGRITMEGVLTEYGSDSWQPWGIAAGPDGSLWFAAEGKVSRAPACGLGFSARFANGTLTMNFNLGVSTPATFNIHLRDATGPFAAPFSRAIPAVIPPRAFTMNWGDFPNKGQVTVVPQLIAGSGAGLCAEWTTVNTAH
jgi:virginiamycin B lyase